jgi:hypothetical protein
VGMRGLPKAGSQPNLPTRGGQGCGMVMAEAAWGRERTEGMFLGVWGRRSWVRRTRR